ncbi:hypothetical protein GE09DRAFT_202 [Coniochaeta sp. 2T2.1]|nr:hypothetical protein GE09DRAFT_202 [Coniochaeta sp. 2T2.1]
MRFSLTNASPIIRSLFHDANYDLPSRCKVTPYPSSEEPVENLISYVYRDAVGHSPPQFPRPTPIGPQVGRSHHCHGFFAPLSNVIRASKFTDARKGYCRGLLFHYSNGGQRALGQCRLGVDPMSEFRNPATLCFRVGQSTDGIQRVWVRLGDIEHDHSERHTCYQMGKGTLGFWTEPIGITGLNVVGGRPVGE